MSDHHNINTPCDEMNEKLMYRDTKPRNDNVWCWTPFYENAVAPVVHCKIQG